MSIFFVREQVLVKVSPKAGCTSAKLKQAWLCSRFALPFETRTQSRTAEQAECRIKRSLNYAEAKPVLAAKQQQYAPSFSLSAPCILLILTRRLRVISNAYFDTPSFFFPGVAFERWTCRGTGAGWDETVLRLSSCWGLNGSFSTPLSCAKHRYRVL